MKNTKSILYVQTLRTSEGGATVGDNNNNNNNNNDGVGGGIEKVMMNYMDTSSSLSSSSSSSKTQSFTPMQQVFRLLPFIIGLGYIYDPIPLDTIIATLWSAIYTCSYGPVFNPLFEAETAVIGFLVPISIFSSMHLFLDKDQTKKLRLDGKIPTDSLSWIVRIENWYEWFNPAMAYLGSIWIYLQFHHRPPIPEDPPTFGVFIIELIFGIWLYDLAFYPLHYIMHNTNNTSSSLKMIRKWHKFHHRYNKKNEALLAKETVQHSYIDGFLQVSINILVQQISPLHPTKHILSRLFHNLIVTYMLSEAHSGYNMPWSGHNIYPNIFCGSPRHDRHHHNGRVYYHQFFRYIDDYFGFIEKEEEKQRMNE